MSRLSMNVQRDIYTSYKHCYILKVLIGITWNSVVTFVSNFFARSTSHKVITLKSSLLEQLVIGDLVLADKGLLIHNIMPPSVSLNI